MEPSDACFNTAGTMSGRTPLGWAARNGHEEVLRALLEWSDVDTDRVDESGLRPLSAAA